MKWLLVGYLLNSLVISEHDSKEACYGRRDVLNEAKANVKCVEAPSNILLSTSTGTTLCLGPNGFSRPC